MDKTELMGKWVKVSKQFLRTEYPVKNYFEMPIKSTGWIVGFRTIQNGQMIDEYDGVHGDGGSYWKPTGYIKCALIATDPCQNPLKVPLDGFELLEA